MSISGISGGFSANSLIAASRVRSRPQVLAPEDVEGVEPPVIELLPPEELLPPPEELLPPLGPGVADLTPRPRGERPFGLFRDEAGRGSGRDENGRSTQNSARSPGDEVQNLENQIVGNPNDSEDDESEGSEAREGAPQLGADIQNIVNRIVDEKEAPGRKEDKDAPPEPGESPIGDGPEEIVNNLVENTTGSDEGEEEEKGPKKESNDSGPAAQELSEQDKKEVQRLQQRDAEVVAHENAHKAAAGGLSNGAIHFDTEKGPDGRNYRTGGHVNINTSKGKTPEETLQRAASIKRAALAPAEPSGQDRSVANKASQMESEARQELAEQRVQEASERAEEAKQNQESNPAQASQGTDQAQPESGKKPEDAGKPETPELPRGARIIQGDEDQDEPEVRVAGEQDEDESTIDGKENLEPKIGSSKDDEDEEKSKSVLGGNKEADKTGPAESRATEAKKPKTIEDAIEQGLDRAGQKQPDEEDSEENPGLGTAGFQIPAFQLNRALGGYQAASNTIQNTPAGSLLRLQA
jgi:hypothetical protein